MFGYVYLKEHGTAGTAGTPVTLVANYEYFKFHTGESFALTQFRVDFGKLS
jgi:hypothetical protein